MYSMISMGRMHPVEKHYSNDFPTWDRGTQFGLAQPAGHDAGCGFGSTTSKDQVAHLYFPPPLLWKAVI